MNEMTIEQTKEMLMQVADTIVAAKPYLTELDSQIGDGDHGIGMSSGLTKAKEALQGGGFTDINGLFRAAGMAMINSMGGASGVIFGTLFLGCTKGLPSTQTLTGPLLADMLSRALAAIQERGKAQVGDKTMVDALAPAVAAMANGPQDDIGATLERGVAAARQGVEDTKQYQAKFGRAKSLLERAIGHQDAGATSVWIILTAMCRYAGGDSSVEVSY